MKRYYISIMSVFVFIGASLQAQPNLAPLQNTGDRLVALVQNMSSERVRDLAVQGVEGINSFGVIPPQIIEGLRSVAKNLDLIVQGSTASWDVFVSLQKLFPFVKDLAIDVAPYIRDAYGITTPLLQGKIEQAGPITDLLIIKLGDALDMVMNQYQPRLIEVIRELQTTPAATRLKGIIVEIARKNGYQDSVNMVNIDNVLNQILNALQNEQILQAIRDGIIQLRTPGLRDRLATKFAPEIEALRRIAGQAINEARAIIKDRTGQEPEQLLEEAKQLGTQGKAWLEEKAGMKFEEILAISQKKGQEILAGVQSAANQIGGAAANEMTLVTPDAKLRTV